MKYTKRVVKIFLYNKNKELLMYLRDNNPLIPNPEYLDLIGGRVEENESDIEALKREIKEEINIEVKNIQYINDVWYKEENSGEKTHILLFRWKIDALLDKINLTECQKLGYYHIEDLNKINIPRIYLDFIEENKIN